MFTIRNISYYITNGATNKQFTFTMIRAFFLLENAFKGVIIRISKSSTCIIFYQNKNFY